MVSSWQRKEAETIPDADYDDAIALQANTRQAETLLHSLERAAAGIGLHVNADKTGCMCFNQRCYISTRKARPFKLVDKFIYLVKQCLINRERHQHTTSKDMDIYRFAIGQMEVRPDR